MWHGAKSTSSHRKPTECCMTREMSNFMKISEILTPESLRTLISLPEVSPASRSRSAGQEKGFADERGDLSLNLPEFLKAKDLAIFV